MKNLHGINLTKLTGLCTNGWTEKILKFNETVISIVDETIPKTSTNHGLMMIAKMSSQIAKMADRHFGRHLTSHNPSNFHIFRAKARGTLKQNRRTSWHNFVSKLTCHTPMNNVWNMVKKNNGKNSKTFKRWTRY